MSVGRVRLGVLVAFALLALLVAVALRPAEVTLAEQDKVDAAALDAKVAEGGPPPAAIPVSRREVLLCLRDVGFDVHSGQPREVLVVSGRGLPETQVRIIGITAAGSTPLDDPSWSATAQALFKMPPVTDRVVRKAFFDCVDPHAPAGIAR